MERDELEGALPRILSNPHDWLPDPAWRAMCALAAMYLFFTIYAAVTHPEPFWNGFWSVVPP